MWWKGGGEPLQRKEIVLVTNKKESSKCQKKEYWKIRTNGSTPDSKLQHEEAIAVNSAQSCNGNRCRHQWDRSKSRNNPIYLGLMDFQQE